MAAPHVVSPLSVADAKIALVTADPSGGTTTYGSVIDVPDMTGVTLEGDVDVKTRRGDGVIRDRRSVLTNVTLTFTASSLSLDALVAIQGGTVVDSGSGTTEVATYSFGASAVSSYLKFEAQCTDAGTGIGDLHLVIYKARLNSFVPIGFTDDDFQAYTFELGAVARDSDSKYYDLVVRETAAAIA